LAHAIAATLKTRDSSLRRFLTRFELIQIESPKANRSIDFRRS
jgi:hypothetical protein